MCMRSRRADVYAHRRLLLRRGARRLVSLIDELSSLALNYIFSQLILLEIPPPARPICSHCEEGREHAMMSTGPQWTFSCEWAVGHVGPSHAQVPWATMGLHVRACSEPRWAFTCVSAVGHVGPSRAGVLWAIMDLHVRACSEPRWAFTCVSAVGHVGPSRAGVLWAIMDLHVRACSEPRWAFTCVGAVGHVGPSRARAWGGGGGGGGVVTCRVDGRRRLDSPTLSLSIPILPIMLVVDCLQPRRPRQRAARKRSQLR